MRYPDELCCAAPWQPAACRAGWRGWSAGLLLPFAAMLLTAVSLLPPELAAATLRVGPERDLKVPSQAARIAQNGDVVEIDAGIYMGDVAAWRQSRLTLRGVGAGRAHLMAAGKAAENKAIWVIKGNDVVVENMEFSGTKAHAFTGAGIRAEGAGLTIRNSHFHDNEMGILTNHNPSSKLVIVDSRFNHNTVDYERHGRLGHNIYVGRIARFELRNSEVFGAQTGHQVKSRARSNEIVGNRIRDVGGASSYLIDIAEGGEAIIRDNELLQSAAAPNRNAIAFAAEAKGKAIGYLVVGSNHFINEGGPGTFVFNHAGHEVVLTNNELIGQVRPLQGPGRTR